MQVLLLTDNTKQAEFIQKGLKYESLSCDIFMFLPNIEFMFENVSLYDGIFLHLEGLSESVYRKIITEVKMKKQIPIFALILKSSDFIESLLSEGLIDGYFIRPFAFRNMSSDMKYEIFLLKERIVRKKIVLRDLEIDLERHQVHINGNMVLLRNKEFALLHFLMMNTGKVVSRTTILENVWDRNSDIMTNTVDVHISQLRKKLERHTDSKFVHTIPCMGYILE